MDPRLPCIRRKLAKVPHAALRSHSFGEEEHRFRLTPPLPPSRLDIFESVHGVELPLAYRSFLTRIGGSGASPFYGLLPLESCELFTMDPQEEPGAPRGFSPAGPPPRGGDLFLRIIDAGCADAVLLGVTGPLTGRVVTGNGDGCWGPDVSSAADFLAWYERWLDHLLDGRDNRALELTSPGLRRRPAAP
ncbi:MULTISPECIES: SMI1/KNR4 family protein [Streptomyces]|uniref:Knr4/Smi1-like domain-containing protein n=1 Tax=Streptomyces albidoflavus TaxID=1886 RepID=A0AA37FE27_9ACTN|nr:MULTISPECIES: SMI1/KNR4 family protein [Streptomyces]MBV7254289.1 SMI1/KNR4 family protein [Streptomyces sp. S-2]RZE51758.1 SMI1/KNR4 family protein [Streptomyces albidoflavus]RZE75541.1 SMI1/KNR4 family protein [Streptomyces albidoflavus]WQG73746.1 SMI1/KNR4 family protein [Streptomyces albidoflavus]GHI48392.1 hypothetical protein ScoT_45660 [Streptomyces albidoflavus]